MTECEKMIMETVEKSKNNEKEIDRLSGEVVEIRNENKAIYELTTSIKLIADSVLRMQSDIQEVKNNQTSLTDKITEIEMKPYKTFSSVKISVITAISTLVATTVVGAILAVVIK